MTRKPPSTSVTSVATVVLPEAPTRVVFRVFPGADHDVIAVFPDHIANPDGDLLCYQHVGQHGAASRYIADRTRLAEPEEYAPLKRELESIGYVLDIRRRITRPRRTP